MYRYFALSVALLASIVLLGQLKTPDEFFDHKRGEHFTYHHDIVRYFHHVADNSPLVSIVEYGKSLQGRPLFIAVITSEANHARLEDIRLNNLRLAQVIDGSPRTEGAPAIVWMSYSIHGNEAAGTESAPMTLFELVDPSNQKTKTWLENTVVIIDPCLNPDGYSRYVDWVRNISGDHLVTHSDDIEHNEPWPGGRVNHYLFDMNRDWAWLTQHESRVRVKLYNQWLPHVHADIHEMGAESPYYFAPAAKPYHAYITSWQREFQELAGRNHAKHFDAHGWLYYTKHRFDLFYPSYGDTYPTYTGAVGMTYEQGGSGRAGRGILTSNGEVVTLKDRLDHHHTATISTVEISHIHAKALVDNFQKFYADALMKSNSRYHHYFIKRDETGNRLAALIELLDFHGIKYMTVGEKTLAAGYHYSQNQEGSMTFESGDLVIPAIQSKGMLAQILFDPEHYLEDSLTYDITAWALPYAYGLDGVAGPQKNYNLKSFTAKTAATTTVRDAYAYIIPWKDLEAAKAASAIQKAKLIGRIAGETFVIDGRKFDRGSIILSRADNRSKTGNFAATLDSILRGIKVEVVHASTGFSDQGSDLGSDNMNIMHHNNVLLIGGEGVSNLEFGQLRWYFDKVINYPVTVSTIGRLANINLERYTTLILPSGNYRFTNDQRKQLSAWVKKGGKLIAIGRANDSLLDTDEFALKSYATDAQKSDAKKQKDEEALTARYDNYDEQERKSISDDVPGAIVKLIVDDSHPLAYGLRNSYHSLRTSAKAYPLMVKADNVIYHPKDEQKTLGFVGAKVRSRLNDSVVFAVEQQGRGHVIYMVDNPLFRGFWYNGLFLFGNALFLVSQ